MKNSFVINKNKNCLVKKQLNSIVWDYNGINKIYLYDMNKEWKYYELYICLIFFFFCLIF